MIGFAFDFADRHDCSLRALHGHADPDAAEATAKLLAPWISAHPFVRVRTDAVAGEPADALLERSRDAGLLVVGNHHHIAALRVRTTGT